MKYFLEDLKMKKNFGVSLYPVLILLILTGVLFGSCSRKQEAAASAGGKETFTLLVDSDRAYEDGFYVLYDVIATEIGVQVELLNFPYAAAVEQKNIMLSTGSYPDAMGGWILGDNDIMTLSADGTILPLEGYIANTTNIKEALAQPGVRQSMTLPDGHIYSPPYIVGEPLVSFSPWINKVWLDQLGLAVPTTTEEFRQALIAFRDKIPPVNGEKVIPFSGSPNNLHLGTLAGWFGVNASGAANNAGYFAVINGQVESTIIRPEYREFIKWFSGLYKEGLVDPEIFTQNEDTWKAKGKRNLYGSSIAYGAGDFLPDLDPKIKESDPSKNWQGWTPLPVLKAPGVANPVFRNNNNGITLFRTQFVVTDKAESKAQKIIDWVDRVYDPIHSTECDAGPMGKTWELKDLVNGIQYWQSFDTSSWTQDERDRNGWGGYSVPSLPKYRRPTWKDQPRPGWENEYKELDIRDALYKPYLEATPMPSLWMSEADAKRTADLQTAITDYVKQKQAEWVSGQADIDREWDAYIAQLNRLGLQELLQLKRSAVK
jgi:putative aldouronate transport system substrate-binding protein